MLLANSGQVMRWRMTLKQTPSRALRHLRQQDQMPSQPEIRQMSQMRRIQLMMAQFPLSI